MIKGNQKNIFILNATKTLDRSHWQAELGTNNKDTLALDACGQVPGVNIARIVPKVSFCAFVVESTT